MIIYICTLEILKTRVQNRFLVHNVHLNLCGQVQNSKRILCSRKTGNIHISDLKKVFKKKDTQYTSKSSY